MELLNRLDAMIDERHLLKHPFYTRWNEGTLPMEALQEYARDLSERQLLSVEFEHEKQRLGARD